MNGPPGNGGDSHQSAGRRSPVGCSPMKLLPHGSRFANDLARSLFQQSSASGVQRMTLKNSRRGQILPFFVTEMMVAAEERRASGDDVLHLEVGQPSTGAPRRAS